MDAAIEGPSGWALSPALAAAPGGIAPDRLWRLRAADGVALRAGLWSGGPRGLAVLLPGRAEFLEKVAITAAALRARGFSVASLDWRGQGASDRLAHPAAKGHVRDFADYGLDLAALLSAPEVAALGPPRLVLAHSMGGAVALLARERLAGVPLVLSAPMLGLAFAPWLRFATAALARGGQALGRGEVWVPTPGAGVPYPLRAGFEGNLMTADRAVWDWLVAAIRAEPRAGLGMPTLGWIAAANRAMAALRGVARWGAPGLALVGDRDRVVAAAAVGAAAARLGFGVALVEGARHEPLIEAAPARGRAWAAVDGFLDRLG